MGGRMIGDYSEPRLTGVRLERANDRFPLLISTDNTGQVRKYAICEFGKFSKSLGSRELVIVRAVSAHFLRTQNHHRAALPAKFRSQSFERGLFKTQCPTWKLANRQSNEIE